MYELIIAEKKAAALAAAEALSGSYKQFTGYVVGENDNKIYTWAIGHLIKILDPEGYDPDWANWSWEHLPMIPKTIKTEIIPNDYIRKQAKIVKELAHRSDVSRIICYTDSALEGQQIYELLHSHFKFNKPDMRLWTNSLQPDAIRKAYKEMKPNSEYKHLANAAMTRAIGDWIIGLNSTRALSLKASNISISEPSASESSASESSNSVPSNNRLETIIRAGRVQSSVLNMVYKREMLRSGFSKLKYYPLSIKLSQNKEHFEAFLKIEKIENRSLTENILSEVKDKVAHIKTVKETDKRTPPPKLLNLTSLTRIANSRFGYTAHTALDLLASLYLKKVVTYPRTDSVHLTEAEIPLMHKSFEVLKSAFPKYAENANLNNVSIENKRICRPELVNDHHAILPEPMIANDLTEDQQNIYQIVLKSFFVQFQNDKLYKEKNLVAEVSGHVFEARYHHTTNLGWQAIFENEDEVDSNEEVEVLNGYPNILVGQANVIDGEILEKETTPPPSYTDGSLITDMENVGKYINDPVLKAKIKGTGIGTSATRAGMIKKLVDTEYLIYKNKKSLGITKKGISVIELIKNSGIKLLISPEMTALWEKELEDIKNGKSNDNFMKSIVAFAHKIVEEAKVIKLDEAQLYEFLGDCPKCKGGIIEGNKRYYCSNHKNGCTFFIWSKQYNKAVSHKMLEQLISKGETNFLSFTSKSNKKYKAKFKLDISEDTGSLQLEFEANSNK